MSASGINRTVLHIDDDPDFTRLVAHKLARLGHDVVSLNDSTKAMGEIMRKGYRVVLLDIDMPGLDGISLLRRIKEYDGGILVIMLSGWVTLSSAMSTFRRGAEACYLKPIEDFQEIAHSIDAAFHKIEHWWTALNVLTRQRREAAAAAALESQDQSHAPIVATVTL